MSKTILVTGGTKGIGKAIIFKFAANGFDVFTCSRNMRDLVQLKQEIEGNFSGRKVFIKGADLSKKDEVLAFAGFVREHGTPDVLVHNAGDFIPGSIHSEPEGNF